MILVTGATGTIGRSLVERLKTRGATFTAMVRDEGKGSALGCRTVVADLDDPASLRAAFAGVDRLLLNSNAGPRMVAQQTAAIDAAKAAGVKHVVKISSPGADSAAKLSMARFHGQVEEHLRSSLLASSILQPRTFMQNLLMQADSVRTQGKMFGAYGEGRIPFTDVEDIAACAAALLTDEIPRHGTFLLNGPEALTYGDVAAKLSARLDRRIDYVDVPVAQMVEGMRSKGIPQQFAEDLGLMMSIIAKGGGAGMTSTVEELTGAQPRTLDRFLDTHIAAFR